MLNTAEKIQLDCLKMFMTKILEQDALSKTRFSLG